MVIVPGFEPLLCIPFSWIGGASRELVSSIAGYAALAVGATLSFFVLRTLDPAAPADLTARSWVQYWSTVTWSGTFLALIAETAGAVVVTAQRPVLSTGVRPPPGHLSGTHDGEARSGIRKYNGSSRDTRMPLKIQRMARTRAHIGA